MHLNERFSFSSCAALVFLENDKKITKIVGISIWLFETEFDFFFRSLLFEYIVWITGKSCHQRQKQNESKLKRVCAFEYVPNYNFFVVLCISRDANGITDDEQSANTKKRKKKIKENSHNSTLISIHVVSDFGRAQQKERKNKNIHRVNRTKPKNVKTFFNCCHTLNWN